MKRRTFIISACTIVAGYAIFDYSLKSSHPDPLRYPKELHRFCNEETILEIGKLYRSLFPEENTKEKLIELLLTDTKGKKLKISDRYEISEFIDKKIYEEFSEYRILTIKGWVISQTESRQCALSSLP